MPRSDQDNGSIFDGLNENAVTIVFGNLLDRYILVRQALQRTLPEDVREAVDLSNINPVETQRSGGSGEGIPDLIISGHGFVLVIEVKIKKETVLQPAQEDVYITYTQELIQDEQTGFVTFLIPTDYHRLGYLKAKSDEDDQSGRVRILPPITWNRLVEELGPPEELADKLIREFYDHLDERFIPKPVRFSAEEVRLMNSKETAIGILKLMDIVDKVKAKLGSYEPSRPSYLDGYEYRFSSITKNKTVYFGIWWGFWAKKGYPLYICIKKGDNKTPQSLLDAFQEKYKDQELLFEDNPNILVAGFMLEMDCSALDCSVLIGNIVTDIETLLRGDGSEESSEDNETL